MPRLTGPNGQFVDLSIVGYEFPESPNRSDGNWLVIRLVASDGSRSWSADDPCMEITDALRLGPWLWACAQISEQIQEDLSALTRTSADGESFWICMDLSVTFTCDISSPNRRLKAVLDQGVRPPAGLRRDDESEVVIDLGFNTAEIQAFANEFDAALAMFPVRGM